MPTRTWRQRPTAGGPPADPQGGNRGIAAYTGRAIRLGTMHKVLFLAALCLASGCRRHISYEEAVSHQAVGPARFFIQCPVGPLATAVQFVNRRAAELCGGAYALEGGSATSRVRQWRDTYGNTHLVNQEGYAATAICR